MSNWFETNATKSVIVHTILVAAAVWAFFIFVFDENKVSFYEAKVGRVEAEAKEVNARNTVLSTRIEYLTDENEKLESWLESTPQTIPYYEKEIESLKNQLKAVTERLSKSAPDKPSVDLSVLYENVQKRDAANTFYDKQTKVVLGVSKINYGDTADIKLTLPNGQKLDAEKVKPGETWQFENDGKNYMLMARL